MTAALDTALAADLRLTVGRLARRLRQQGGSGGLSPSQLSALASVEDLGPLRLGDLAAREGVAAPTMSRVVAHLEDDGLVTRTPDVGDRRAALLKVTPAGRARLRRIRGERTALLQRRLDALTPDERRRLAEALPVLMRLTEDEQER